MKKIFAAFALFLCMLTANAQINYGARGGINFATLTGDGYKVKPGFHLGGFVQIGLRNGFSVQPEAYISSQGANWENDGKTSLSYLNIPVLAKYKTASGFFAETGPQIGFMLSAYDTYKGEKEDVKQYLKTTDFSWALGAGYQLNPQIGINARYNVGLNNFWKKEKNSVAMIGVHYTIGSTAKK